MNRRAGITVFPVLLYGCETWSTTVAEEKKLAVTQHSMERRMLGVNRAQRICNNKLRLHFGVKDMIDEMYASKISWTVHVARMINKRWTKRVIDWYPRRVKRPAGRPPMRWSDPLTRLYGVPQMRRAQLGGVVVGSVTGTDQQRLKWTKNPLLKLCLGKVNEEAQIFLVFDLFRDQNVCGFKFGFLRKKTAKTPPRPRTRSLRQDEHFLLSRREPYEDHDTPRDSVSSPSRPVPLLRRMLDPRVASGRNSVARAARVARRQSSTSSSPAAATLAPHRSPKKLQDVHLQRKTIKSLFASDPLIEKRLKASRLGTVRSGVKNQFSTSPLK
ncbi:unnamed protein product, partial [Gongylonema pulchrum]|uniref:Uncharacterized protein n=1 Tax=Gongylonema pulchrum TaxID=637853 RepID=A0A183EH89_9BILA